ncbi:MAG: hypothetical protein V4627_11210 [Pseudomonadota bacterium]
MKTIVLAVGVSLALWLSPFEVAAKSAPLVENSYAFDTQTPHTAEQVRGYILAGAGRYKELTYKIESDSPGVLQLEFNKGDRHYVSVMFVYDNAGFKTVYVKSQNLGYEEKNGVRTIHPNYMVWLDEMFLRMKISGAMKLDAQGQPTDPNAASHVTFRAADSGGSALISMTDEASDCGKLERVGYVSAGVPGVTAEVQRKENEEWNEQNKADIATGKKSKRSFITRHALPTYVEPQRPLQVSAYTSTTVGTTTISCGPVVRGFTPTGGKKYTVEFFEMPTGRRGSCGLVIVDDTDPAVRVPVPHEEITFKECKKKFLFF